MGHGTASVVAGTVVGMNNPSPSSSTARNAAASTTPVIRLRSQRDVLATIPRLLGYRPRNSIVFLALHDENGVSTMRVDLPAPSSAGDEKRAITSIVGTLCRVPGVQVVLLAVYSDDPADVAGPRARLVTELVRRVELCGFCVHDSLFVASDGWGSYAAGRRDPRPLDVLDTPAEGDVVTTEPLASVDHLAAVAPAPVAERRAFSMALERVVAERLAEREVESAVALADAALHWPLHALDLVPYAILGSALTDPDLRDEMIFTWAWGVDRGSQVAATAHGADGIRGPRAVDDGLAMDLVGLGDGARPDGARVARVEALLARLAALAADEPVVLVPALTVLAWMQWARGASSLAGRSLERAAALDPRYGLAELLAGLLAKGLLPNWAFERPAGGAATSNVPVGSR